MAREIQGEGGAFPDRAIDENIAPRLFNNTVGGGEPQPRPLAGLPAPQSVFILGPGSLGASLRPLQYRIN